MSNLKGEMAHLGIEMNERPSLRLFSPNLKFIVFASGQAFYCRKDLAVITENDQKEAGDILDLLMEEDAGHC